MEILVETLTGVDFPSMRAEVRSAVEILANPDHQREVWVEGNLPQGVFYDNLDLQIHLLFDDTIACSDPEGAVPAILYEDEVAHFLALAAALNRLLSDPALVRDADFIRDPRWASVVERAERALKVMAKNGDGVGSRNEVWRDEE